MTLARTPGYTLCRIPSGSLLYLMRSYLPPGYRNSGHVQIGKLGSRRLHYALVDKGTRVSGMSVQDEV